MTATCRAVVGVFTLFTLPVFPQKAPSVPHFEDYSVLADFNGTPAPPQLVRPEDRLYRTKIREAGKQAEFLRGTTGIIGWGCGAGCLEVVIVDAITGTVGRLPHEVPFKLSGVLTECDLVNDPLQFRLDSRLLIVRSCLEDNDLGVFYLEWTGKSFHTIAREEIPAQR